MKALSVKQPYASLIASGVKTLEARSWRTSHRGPLVIVSSSQPDRPALAKFRTESGKKGVTIVLVELLNIREGRKSDKKAALVDPTGKYVWELRVVRELPAVPVKGRLNLYTLPRDVARRCGIKA